MFKTITWIIKTINLLVIISIYQIFILWIDQKIHM